MTQIIAQDLNLPSYQKETLCAAACFHDTGLRYIFKGHEYVSAANAKAYLEKINYLKDNLKQVISCIMATKMPQSPKNLLEQIICDADLSHLGCTTFFVRNRKLRMEWQRFLKLNFTDKEWRKKTFDFLIEHTYFTDYGKQFLAPIKRQNLLMCATYYFSEKK